MECPRCGSTNCTCEWVHDIGIECCSCGDCGYEWELGGEDDGDEE